MRAECALRDHPTLGRWLRQQANGRLEVNRSKVNAEVRLDGKYLIATSDPHISPGTPPSATRTCSRPRCCFRDLKARCCYGRSSTASSTASAHTC